MFLKALFLGATLFVSSIAAATAADLPGEKLKAIVDQAAASGVPGAVLLVETRSGDRWVGAAGVERQGGAPTTPDSVFRVYSTSKMIVAATAFTLIDEKTLGLDDRLDQWLTPDQLGRLPGAGAITVRQLIAQTSGIRDYFDDHFIDLIKEDFARVWTPAELLNIAADGEPAAAPGTGSSYYSNTNYVLLGLVIEKAAGASLSNAIRTHVLEPLGADHTFSWEEQGRPAPVAGYLPLGGGELLDVSAVDLSISWGAGGIISTATDLAKLTRGILAGSLLSDASRELMTTNFRPMADKNVAYGYGSFRVPFEHPLIGHSGEGPGFGVLALLSPDDDTVIVAMTNLQTEAHFTMLERALEALGK
jgi:D-alanyl-D-alanine carboxypeptidase